MLDCQKKKKQLLEVSTPDGNNAMTNRIRRMIEGFEPIDARDLNKLVDMNEEPSTSTTTLDTYILKFIQYRARYNLKSV